jgi:DUF309 family protein family protein
MHPGIEEGIRLFNTQEFFEAHEALEAVWLRATGEEKAFLHGLIQIAAAFHHYTRGNPAGFRSLLEKGLEKLARVRGLETEIDLVGLRRQLAPWRRFAKRVAEQRTVRYVAGPRPGPPPPLPRIKRVTSSTDLRF